MTRISFPNTLLELLIPKVGELEALFQKGVHPARSLKRAQVLLGLQKGKKADQVAAQVGVSLATVYNIAHRYRQSGKLTEALQEKPRLGQPSKFDQAAQAQLTAVACSQAPPGHSRWTLPLLANKLGRTARSGFRAPSGSGRAAKKTCSSRGSKNNGASGK